MEKLKDLVKDIRTDIETAEKPKHNSSQKDEMRVMKAMLNDKSFKVGVYSTKGKESEYCPAEVAHSLVGDVISNATKISKKEAADIADNYTFTNSDAKKMVQLSKEFINVYTDTRRNINLGRREETHISLLKKDIPAHERNYPKKVVDANGNVSYEKATTKVPAHVALRAMSKCPEHLK